MEEELFEFLSNIENPTVEYSDFHNNDTSMDSQLCDKAIAAFIGYEFLSSNYNLTSGHTITKLPKFYEAKSVGGIKNWLDDKKKKEKLNKDLIKSSIRTNKNAIVSNRIAILVSGLTFVILFFQTFLTSNSELKDIQSELKNIKEVLSYKTKKDSPESLLLDDQTKRDSLTKAPQK